MSSGMSGMSEKEEQLLACLCAIAQGYVAPIHNFSPSAALSALLNIVILIFHRAESFAFLIKTQP
jgi:hypothetical protein